MTKRAGDAMLLTLVLTYSFVVILWGVMREPLAPVEARTIFMGRKMISDCMTGGGTSNQALDELIRGNFGSVAIAPAFLAIAEGASRIYGARLVCGVLGLFLIGLIYLTGNSSQYGRRGLLAASTFVSLGLPLQLSSCASSDLFAAVFLGASLWCVEGMAGEEAVRQRRLALLLGGLSLALAVMTSYFVFLFLLPLLLLVFLRHRFSDAAFFYVLPVVVVLAFYGYFAVLPSWPVLKENILFHFNPSAAFSGLPVDYLFNWLAMPFLLATVGFFHKDGGKKSLFMLLAASFAFLVQLVSMDVNDVHTVVLFAMILLAPAAALGIAQMADIFTANNGMVLARPFFVAAILIIIWVFGVQQIKELIRERPDLSSAVSFLQAREGGATVLVDSDYGSPQYVYHYYLDNKTPPVRVVSLVRADEKERISLVKHIRPEYVVIDSYHSARSFNEACSDYIRQGFTVAATYNMPLASGDNIIRIFQKGAL